MARTWAQFGEKVNPFHHEPKIKDQDPTISERVTRSLKRNLNPCYATNCKTVAGLIGCLITDPQFAKYETPDKFFFKNGVGANSGETFITRPVKVALYSRSVKTSDDDSTERYEEAQYVNKVVNIIAPKAYKAFLNVARANQNCMEVFCKHNCLIVDKMDDKTIDSQTVLFKNAGSDVWVRNTKYTPAKLADMTDEDLRTLAQQFLQDRRNSIISLRCLSEMDGGVKMRMFCNECAKALDGSLGQVNRTCQTFDPSQNVASDIKSFELDAEYQQKLAEIQKEQDLNLREVANNADNVTSTAGINFKDISTTINNGVDSLRTIFGK